MELQKVKEYLRVDFDEDDSFLLTAMDAADAYLDAAIDEYERKLKNEKFRSKADICRLALIQDMYDRHMLMDKDSRDLNYSIRSMISQMQFGRYE